MYIMIILLITLYVVRAGSDDDEKLTSNSVGEKMLSGNGRRTQQHQHQLPVVSRLEVSKTKVKRKRRKSWTCPIGRQSSSGDGGGGGGGGGGVGGPCRKGHSLDQGYEDFGHRQHHPSLFRSCSSNENGGGGVGTVVLDGCAGDDVDGDVPGSRQFRTPSVVVSDYSEGPVSYSSMFTLDDLGELEPGRSADCAFNDSSSDCSAASTWSAAGSVISVLDADYSLHTPERKISGCSTCTFSGGEDEEDAAAYRLSKLKPKVSAVVITIY